MKNCVIIQSGMVFCACTGCEYPFRGVIIYSGVVFGTTGEWEIPSLSPQSVIMHLRVVFPTSGGCECPPQSVTIHSRVVICTSGGWEYPPQGVIMYLRVVFPTSGGCEYAPRV